MNRGYFADMKEFKEHGGKVMLQLLSLSRLFSLAMAYIIWVRFSVTNFLCKLSYA